MLCWGAFALGVTWAFLARSLATFRSYRAKASLGLASLLLTVVTFAFVGRVVAASGPGFADRFGVDYTSFVIVGVLVHAVASSGLHVFRTAVRREQLQGTLEILVTSALPVPVVLILAGASELLATAVGAAAFLTAASLITGLRVAATPAALAGVLLYLVFMSGMGLASAGCVLVSKEGDPVSWAFGAGTALLGGVYFPVDLLPDWLRGVASLVPTTHALSLVRSGLGAPVSSRPAASLLFLVAAAASSLGVGLLVLRWGHRRARRTGTLGEY